MTASALVAADAALERGEVPTVPHAGSPCEAVAWLVRTSTRPMVEIRWYDLRTGVYRTRFADPQPEASPAQPRE